MLEDNNIIGIGMHKTVYLHPCDDSLCIKIPHKPNDIDLKRELRYRMNVGENRKSLIPCYYGTINTVKGLGYIFELVKDYDESISSDFESFLKEFPQKFGDKEILRNVILQFKNEFYYENVVLTDADPGNFVIQRLTSSKFKLRIVDNIGSPVLIPLEYYINYFAKTKAKRCYKRFLGNLHRKFPEIFTIDFIKELTDERI